jgi:hypothetical protein
MTRVQLTQAERDLIVELCRIALDERNGLPTGRRTAYDQFTREDWERVASIVSKWDTLDLDILPPQHFQP